MSARSMPRPARMRLHRALRARTKSLAWNDRMSRIDKLGVDCRACQRWDGCHPGMPCDSSAELWLVLCGSVYNRRFPGFLLQHPSEGTGPGPDDIFYRNVARHEKPVTENLVPRGLRKSQDKEYLGAGIAH